MFSLDVSRVYKLYAGGQFSRKIVASRSEIFFDVLD